MNVYSAKEKDEILFEITKAHPNHCIIDNDIKHEIAKGCLIPDGYIKILVEYDQGNMIAYQATQKGIDFIAKGGYTKEEKVIQSLSLSKKIKKRAIEIAVGVSIVVIAGLIMYYIFGIKSS